MSPRALLATTTPTASRPTVLVLPSVYSVLCREPDISANPPPRPSSHHPPGTRPATPRSLVCHPVSILHLPTETARVLMVTVVFRSSTLPNGGTVTTDVRPAASTDVFILQAPRHRPPPLPPRRPVPITYTHFSSTASTSVHRQSALDQQRPAETLDYAQPRTDRVAKEVDSERSSCRLPDISATRRPGPVAPLTTALALRAPARHIRVAPPGAQ
ncbi:hypothetical protein C2E23DRAFT_820443 [Lenzites betulinus]|nr:hypothetical protein C2E23DRAFT_820443 [Lenzites betulinus]